MHYRIVDVFAENKYAGNPLAVVLDAGGLSDAAMQAIAREMHLSETAFVRSAGGEEHAYDVRIFTPEREVPFAGHPTLGTAYVIREEVLQEPVPEVRLNLAAGEIPVSFTPDGLLWMRQNPPAFMGELPADTLAGVLSLPEEAIDLRFPVEEVSTGLPFIIVPVRSREAVRRAKIDRDAYEALIRTTAAKAVFVFCPEPYRPENTFNARMFADHFGVPEDPATGSANGCLAGYLLRHGYFPGDSLSIRVEQGCEIGRPSLIYCRAERREESIAVQVGGRVIPVARGELL
ncbi:PhzF family phenazine biosynthesis protein [Methanoculleus sp. Wushi-C6]|uniref:PhzF family phenazine biosynthesis protein n=1 Tax=Methanoculleus caldifontis TaxID=2651577 RepID=A0ABU3X2C4_9EURY|nr:PhzF family phenazine biosynthesis protein [Methanoculleus sp. Wushi-C6]MDV2482223.1 PhzF family phenazine biosynthesis protein [Methanoculleus sp. Wushi-C6]